jgi:excisionase family DNA binding protein
VDREYELIGPGEAGRLLGVTSESVRRLIAQGKLAATRTVYGYRVIRREDVLDLARVRAKDRRRAAAVRR